MITFRFPSDRIVGEIAWLDPRASNPMADRASGRAPAKGVVEVPDGSDVDLNIDAIANAMARSRGAGVMIDASMTLDVGFLAGLPTDVVTSLSIRGPIAVPSLAALATLAPSLTTLALPFADLPDEALPHVATLVRLQSLQTFGNRFTDEGVQALAGMTSLRRLYLEEFSLTAEAFGFVADLPGLEVLGVQDVQLTDDEYRALAARLPHVQLVR